MGNQKAGSLQDILKRRQQEDFVGRAEQLVFFRRNLGYEPDDERWRFIIGVSGQGGVGKTWLLRRFRKIAEEFACVGWSGRPERVYSAHHDQRQLELFRQAFSRG